MAEQLSVAVCQMTSNDDVDQNTRQIFSLLKNIEGQGVDLACFPENALYFRTNDKEPRVAISMEDVHLRDLSTWVMAQQTTVHLGSVPLAEGAKVFAASVLLTPDGHIQANYRKIHLFDVDVVGHKPVRESEVFSAGEKPFCFDLKGWRFGSSICYDLRFSELFQIYAKEEVDVILIPSAFLVPTGKAHWHVMTRARAIESQAYVLAAAQGGSHHGNKGGTRETYGHSLVVDPWGTIVDECVEGQSRVLRVTLEKERIRKVRAQIPMRNHRRL